METDKKAVSAFYDRDYIAERLKGLETELSLECRITLNGEERWVRNVIIRGEIEDSEYAMIFRCRFLKGIRHWNHWKL